MYLLLPIKVMDVNIKIKKTFLCNLFKKMCKNQLFYHVGIHTLIFENKNLMFKKSSFQIQYQIYFFTDCSGTISHSSEINPLEINVRLYRIKKYFFYKVNFLLEYL